MGSSNSLRARERCARALLRVPAGRHRRRGRASEGEENDYACFFLAGAAVSAPTVPPQTQTQKKWTVLAAGGAPRGGRVVAHVLK